MQLQAIGSEQGAEESMRRQAKSPLIESRTHHDEPRRQSRRYRTRGHKTCCKLHHCHIPLTYEFL
jgi:hypothetical protein